VPGGSSSGGTGGPTRTPSAALYSSSRSRLVHAPPASLSWLASASCPTPAPTHHPSLRPPPPTPHTHTLLQSAVCRGGPRAPRSALELPMLTPAAERLHRLKTHQCISAGSRPAHQWCPRLLPCPAAHLMVDGFSRVCAASAPTPHSARGGGGIAVAISITAISRRPLLRLFSLRMLLACGSGSSSCSCIFSLPVMLLSSSSSSRPLLLSSAPASSPRLMTPAAGPGRHHSLMSARLILTAG